MNFRMTWERLGMRPRRLTVLLIGFAIAVLVVSPLGVYDVLGFTCDAREKVSRAILSYCRESSRTVMLTGSTAGLSLLLGAARASRYFWRTTLLVFP